MSQQPNSEQPDQGTVVAVRGSVVDAHFPKGLPNPYNLLQPGDQGQIIIEVVAHFSSEMVRGIARPGG